MDGSALGWILGERPPQCLKSDARSAEISDILSQDQAEMPAFHSRTRRTGLAVTIHRDERLPINPVGDKTKSDSSPRPLLDRGGEGEALEQPT